MKLDYLINPVRLEVVPGHNVYFTSDTHFGHNKEFLYGKRGFKNVMEHDGAIIERWNRVVGKGDTVIHCGDVMFGEGGAERLLSILKVLNFKKLWLLPGNHHAGYKQLLRLVSQDGTYLLEDGDELKEIELVPNYMEFVVNRQPMVVCHYPIASWNGMGKGVWCISGHCHGSFHGSQKDAQEGKILDLGIEVVEGPISFCEVAHIMEHKAVKIVDHHGENTSTSLH